LLGEQLGNSKRGSKTGHLRTGVHTADRASLTMAKAKAGRQWLGRPSRPIRRALSQNCPVCFWNAATIAIGLLHEPVSLAPFANATLIFAPASS